MTNWILTGIDRESSIYSINTYTKGLFVEEQIETLEESSLLKKISANQLNDENYDAVYFMDDSFRIIKKTKEDIDENDDVKKLLQRSDYILIKPTNFTPSGAIQNLPKKDFENIVDNFNDFGVEAKKITFDNTKEEFLVVTCRTQQEEDAFFHALKFNNTYLLSSDEDKNTLLNMLPQDKIGFAEGYTGEIKVTLMPQKEIIGETIKPEELLDATNYTYSFDDYQLRKNPFIGVDYEQESIQQEEIETLNEELNQTKEEDEQDENELELDEDDIENNQIEVIEEEQDERRTTSKTKTTSTQNVQHQVSSNDDANNFIDSFSQKEQTQEHLTENISDDYEEHNDYGERGASVLDKFDNAYNTSYDSINESNNQQEKPNTNETKGNFKETFAQETNVNANVQNVVQQQPQISNNIDGETNAQTSQYNPKANGGNYNYGNNGTPIGAENVSNKPFASEYQTYVEQKEQQTNYQTASSDELSSQNKIQRDNYTSNQPSTIISDSNTTSNVDNGPKYIGGGGSPSYSGGGSSSRTNIKPNENDIRKQESSKNEDLYGNGVPKNKGTSTFGGQIGSSINIQNQGSKNVGGYTTSETHSASHSHRENTTNAQSSKGYTTKSFAINTTSVGGAISSSSHGYKSTMRRLGAMNRNEAYKAGANIINNTLSKEANGTKIDVDKIASRFGYKSGKALNNSTNDISKNLTKILKAKGISIDKDISKMSNKELNNILKKVRATGDNSLIEKMNSFSSLRNIRTRMSIGGMGMVVSSSVQKGVKSFIQGQLSMGMVGTRLVDRWHFKNLESENNDTISGMLRGLAKTQERHRKVSRILNSADMVNRGISRGASFVGSRVFKVQPGSIRKGVSNRIINATNGRGGIANGINRLARWSGNKNERMANKAQKIANSKLGSKFIRYKNGTPVMRGFLGRVAAMTEYASPRGLVKGGYKLAKMGTRKLGGALWRKAIAPTVVGKTFSKTAAALMGGPIGIGIKIGSKIVKGIIKSVKDFNEFITDLVSKVITFIFITFLIIIVVVALLYGIVNLIMSVINFSYENQIESFRDTPIGATWANLVQEEYAFYQNSTKTFLSLNNDFLKGSHTKASELDDIDDNYEFGYTKKPNSNYDIKVSGYTLDDFLTDSGHKGYVSFREYLNFENTSNTSNTDGYYYGHNDYEGTEYTSDEYDTLMDFYSHDETTIYYYNGDIKLKYNDSLSAKPISAFCINPTKARSAITNDDRIQDKWVNAYETSGDVDDIRIRLPGRLRFKSTEMGAGNISDYTHDTNCWDNFVLGKYISKWSDANAHTSISGRYGIPIYSKAYPFSLDKNSFGVEFKNQPTERVDRVVGCVSNIQEILAMTVAFYQNEDKSDDGTGTGFEVGAQSSFVSKIGNVLVNGFNWIKEKFKSLTNLVFDSVERIYNIDIPETLTDPDKNMAYTLYNSMATTIFQSSHNAYFVLINDKYGDPVVRYCGESVPGTYAEFGVWDNYEQLFRYGGDNTTYKNFIKDSSYLASNMGSGSNVLGANSTDDYIQDEDASEDNYCDNCVTFTYKYLFTTRGRGTDFNGNVDGYWPKLDSRFVNQYSDDFGESWPDHYLCTCPKIFKDYWKARIRSEERSDVSWGEPDSPYEWYDGSEWQEFNTGGTIKYCAGYNGGTYVWYNPIEGRFDDSFDEVCKAYDSVYYHSSSCECLYCKYNEYGLISCDGYESDAYGISRPYFTIRRGPDGSFINCPGHEYKICMGHMMAKTVLVTNTFQSPNSLYRVAFYALSDESGTDSLASVVQNIMKLTIFAGRGFYDNGKYITKSANKNFDCFIASNMEGEDFRSNVRSLMKANDWEQQYRILLAHANTGVGFTYSNFIESTNMMNGTVNNPSSGDTYNSKNDINNFLSESQLNKMKELDGISNDDKGLYYLNPRRMAIVDFAANASGQIPYLFGGNYGINYTNRAGYKQSADGGDELITIEEKGKADVNVITGTGDNTDMDLYIQNESISGSKKKYSWIKFNNGESGYFPDGTDCSGFVTWVYNQCGVPIWSDQLSDNSKKYGNDIARLSTTSICNGSSLFVECTPNELRPGDLLAYSSPDGSSPGHVKIFVAWKDETEYLHNGKRRAITIDMGGTNPVTSNVQVAGYYYESKLLSMIDETASSRNNGEKGVIRLALTRALNPITGLVDLGQDVESRGLVSKAYNSFGMAMGRFEKELYNLGASSHSGGLSSWFIGNSNSGAKQPALSVEQKGKIGAEKTNLIIGNGTKPTLDKNTDFPNIIEIPNFCHINLDEEIPLSGTGNVYKCYKNSVIDDYGSNTSVIPKGAFYELNVDDDTRVALQNETFTPDRQLVNALAYLLQLIGYLLFCLNAGKLIMAFKNEDVEAKTRSIQLLIASSLLINLRGLIIDPIYHWINGG